MDFVDALVVPVLPSPAASGLRPATGGGNPFAALLGQLSDVEATPSVTPPAGANVPTANLPLLPAATLPHSLLPTPAVAELAEAAPLPAAHPPTENDGPEAIALPAPAADLVLPAPSAPPIKTAITGAFNPRIAARLQQPDAPQAAEPVQRADLASSLQQAAPVQPQIQPGAAAEGPKATASELAPETTELAEMTALPELPLSLPFMPAEPVQKAAADFAHAENALGEEQALLAISLPVRAPTSDKWHASSGSKTDHKQDAPAASADAPAAEVAEATSAPGKPASNPVSIFEKLVASKGLPHELESSKPEIAAKSSPALAHIPAAMATPAVAEDVSAGLTSEKPQITLHVRQSAEVPERVSVIVSRAAAESMREFTIRMDPPELGRIDIKLSIEKDGSVQAVIASDNPHTHDLLRREASTFERSLSDGGFKTDSNSLNFSLRDGQNQSQQQAQNGASSARQQGSADNASAADIPPAIFEPLRQRFATARVNITA
jgi:flagellar hook-length control protein FliK